MNWQLLALTVQLDDDYLARCGNVCGKAVKRRRIIIQGSKKEMISYRSLQYNHRVNCKPH